MSDGPGLLALVIDDPLAARFIAWWKATRPSIDDFPKLRPVAGRLIMADDLDLVTATFDRCRLAGLIQDGGISDEANRWLNMLVGTKLGLHKVKPVAKPSKECSSRSTPTSSSTGSRPCKQT